MTDILRFAPAQEDIAVKASADDFIVLRHNPSNTGPAILLAGIPGPAGPPSLAEWQRTDW